MTDQQDASFYKAKVKIISSLSKALCTQINGHLKTRMLGMTTIIKNTLSNLLKELVMVKINFTQAEMRDELRTRKRILDWMVLNDIRKSDQVAQIIDTRLAELTPEHVKEIVQTMIRRHLGWLVVWGGVFGGAIGLSISVLQGI